MCLPWKQDCNISFPKTLQKQKKKTQTQIRTEITQNMLYYAVANKYT